MVAGVDDYPFLGRWHNSRRPVSNSNNWRWTALQVLEWKRGLLSPGMTVDNRDKRVSQSMISETGDREPTNQNRSRVWEISCLRDLNNSSRRALDFLGGAHDQLPWRKSICGLIICNEGTPGIDP
ncbi:hypothetical protein RU639_010759 [Aspergillus parasiticus]